MPTVTSFQNSKCLGFSYRYLAHADNFTGCRMVVTIPGDITSDGIVDIYVAMMLANAYNSKPVSPSWNPNVDINGDGTVDIYYALILANHYNQDYQ